PSGWVSRCLGHRMRRRVWSYASSMRIWALTVGWERSVFSAAVVQLRYCTTAAKERSCLKSIENLPQRPQRFLHVLGGVPPAEGEADGAGGEGAQGLVGGGGAVEPHPGHDAVAAVQLVGNLRKLPLRRLDGRHPGAPGGAAKPRELNLAVGLHGRKSPKELRRQRQLVAKDLLGARLPEPQKPGAQAENAGQVHGARLEAVGQKIRYRLGVAQAAGAAGEKRRHLTLHAPL